MAITKESEDEYLKLVRNYQLGLPGARAFGGPPGRSSQVTLVLEKTGSPDGVAVLKNGEEIRRLSEGTQRSQLKELAALLDYSPSLQEGPVRIDSELSCAALKYLATGLLKEAGGRISRESKYRAAADLLLGGKPTPGIDARQLDEAVQLLRKASDELVGSSPLAGKRGLALYREVAALVGDVLPGMLETAAGKVGIKVEYW